VSTRGRHAPRAVVDTNVLARGLLRPGGPSAALLQAAEDATFRLVLSPSILQEARKIFFKPHVRQRYPLSLEQIASYMASLQVLAEVVPGRLQVYGASRDPDDNQVLACAVEGEVDFVVSNDRKHILPLGEYRGIAIVSLRAFLQMLRWR
jgi:putative PIN family toxin of toxin-antitoxin system